MHGIGLISNPFSKKNRKNPDRIEMMKNLLPDSSLAKFPSSFDELEEDPSLLTEKKKSSKLGSSLPFSLYDSIIEFEKDSGYTKGVFSPEFISDYIALKLAEYKEEISRPSGFDYKEYFNV